MFFGGFSGVSLLQGYLLGLAAFESFYVAISTATSKGASMLGGEEGGY